ncbi:MAG: aminotransferase class V-fold PLP-dependent enzyme [Rhodothermia bacterium]|nr:MAG: aminotransferase class V-fold PLP-dependent enzyme [Rhodothermia bacterium]
MDSPMNIPDPISRRRFLSQSARFSLSLPLLSPTLIARTLNAERPLRFPDTPEWVVEARKRIPSAGVSKNFQTAGIGPSSTLAINELTSKLIYQNRFGPTDPRQSDMALIEPTLRMHLADAFGANADEVALTHSTSEGINIASWSLNWKEGDEIVISNQEHPANIVPWYNLRDRFGIVIREIDLGIGTELVPEVERQLTDRTRMVSISHVSRNNGRALRTEHSADLAVRLQSRGVVFHLDGAQGPGCIPVDFHELGSDCYSTCGHKWLLGPKGTGAFFVRKEHLDHTLMSWTGSHSHDEFDYEGHFTLKDEASRFEFGTRALADFAGFDVAITWVESLGLQRILERIRELGEYAIEKANEMNGFGFSSPPDKRDRSGIFVLRLPEGCSSWDVYYKLRDEDYIHTSPVRADRDLRLALHFFNTTDEIDESFKIIQRYSRA